MNKSTQLISKILTIMVMPQEWEQIAKKHNYIEDPDLTNKHKEILKAFKTTYTDQDGNKSDGFLIVPIKDPLHDIEPVGAEICFLLTYIGIKHYDPDVVLSIGFAGSTDVVDYKVGDIILGKGNGIYHKRDVIIPPYKPIIKGNYPFADSSSIAKELGFFTGSIGTSDVFEARDDTAIEMGISCLDMECASMARACFYLKKPCIPMKIISDTTKKTESDRNEEFTKSADSLRNRLEEAYAKLVTYLIGKEKSLLTQ